MIHGEIRAVLVVVHDRQVDDEQPLLEMLTERLCAAGFSVTAKNDPIAAVNIFKKNTGIFDLVITDHFMPGTTGLEFAETIHYFNPEIPVILISGFGTEIAKSELKETGIKGIICKPVIFNELFISIKKIFESDES